MKEYESPFDDRDCTCGTDPLYNHDPSCPAIRSSPPHVCKPEYVAEGEVVCFECGAYYIFHSNVDAEGLEEMRSEIEGRAE